MLVSWSVAGTPVSADRNRGAVSVLLLWEGWSGDRGLGWFGTGTCAGRWKSSTEPVLRFSSTGTLRCRDGRGQGIRETGCSVCRQQGHRQQGHRQVTARWLCTRQCGYLHLHSNCFLLHNDFVHSGVLNLICIDLGCFHLCILNSER